MRIGQRSIHMIATEVLQVKTVEQQEVGELDSVDGAEAVKLEDAGDGIGVFNLCQPCVGDVKLWIALRFGDPLAKVGDFTGRDAQTGTNIFQLFARSLSISHAQVYLKR